MKWKKGSDYFAVSDKDYIITRTFHPTEKFTIWYRKEPLPGVFRTSKEAAKACEEDYAKRFGGQK